MILLALSTSGKAACAALIKDGVLISQALRDEGRTHSETVMPLAAALLAEQGFSPMDVDVFAADVGPGSFTGVRIGVCAANAMAAVKGVPVIGVSSLAALAEPFMGEEQAVCAVLDARNGNGYAALYENGSCTVAPSAVVFAEFLPTLPENTLFVGDAAIIQRKRIEETVPGARFAPDDAHLLTAAPVAREAWRLLQRGETASEVMPLYLRPTQAERLYKEKK